jgi:hypothetical protein
MGWSAGSKMSSSKISNLLPASLPLLGSESVPIVQGGATVRAPVSSIGNANGQLISTTPFSLIVLGVYGLRTLSGALILNLPSLSSMAYGDWIDLEDIDYNANVNNVTINAAGSDTIALYGAATASQTLNVAGVRARLIVNVAGWSLMI